MCIGGCVACFPCHNRPSQSHGTSTHDVTLSQAPIGQRSPIAAGQQKKWRRVETGERALDFFVLGSRRRGSTVRSQSLNLPKDLKKEENSSLGESATSG
ncbi:unnamed protein product [Heterotrigona itama]|uniref:Uncharacterized protein n=1 Tax=Heterotrigona itama TaxID=395501 RepID=A0A6V7HIB6_9HYME|nr:unnamed protein product [Heterotrigona itama]